MKTIEKDFIELTKRAINLEYQDDGFFCNTDWQSVIELANSNKLGGIIFKAAAAQSSLPADLKKNLDHYKFQIYVRQKNHYHILRQILDVFEEEKLNYACFKGNVLAELYPEPEMRLSSDSDILISLEDCNRAKEIILEKGYEIVPEKSKDKVFVFYYPKTSHMIELHTSLYEDYEGAKIKILEDGHFENPNTYIYLDVQKKPMKTLGYDEHLVYQIFHIIKHFMLEGANIRFFTDITLFVNKYINNLNADVFWDWMDRLNYTYFAENFLQVCVRYFGMDENFLQGRKGKAGEEAIDAMIVDFIYNGNVDKTRQESWQLISSLSPYLVGEATSVKKNTNERKVRFLFPSSEEIGDYYSYAKAHKWLLPLAWIHRFFHTIRWQIFHRKKTEYNTLKKAKVVQNRLGLMASVGLLDEE